MSASPKLPPDHEARRRATRDFSTNLVVVAGAGTGKTSLLVERALMALGSGLVEAGQVAAITFTEKAAGEMQQRLATGLEHLRALAVGTPPTDLDRTARAAFDALTLEGKVSPAAVAERTLLALRQLDRMAVKNMHGLCIDLLRGWPCERPIGLACPDGTCSSRLAIRLSRQGFTVYHLAGGIHEWRQCTMT